MELMKQALYLQATTAGSQQIVTLANYLDAFVKVSNSFFQGKLELLREKGFTVTHFVCALLIFIPNVLSKTIFFLIYRKFGPALENFYDLLSNQQSIILPEGL